MDELDFGNEKFAFQLRPSDPPRYLAFIPKRLRRKVEIVLMFAGRDEQGEVDIRVLGVVTEPELRSFARGCSEVADWLHEHTQPTR